MRLLVLGGTIFLGRHVVEQALQRGHEVAVFNRGRSGEALFPAAERLRGDRNGDLSALRGREWDVVIDSSAYLPRQATATADLLAQSVDHYVFVSSVSVYADFSQPGITEDAPKAALSQADSEDELGADYGPLKVLCEEAVEQALPGRAAIVRPGLIAGPYDPTNRFTYWVTRLARGGDVLAPEPRDQPVQVIDARDLASWLLDLGERRTAGIFNAVGPATPITLAEALLDIAAAVGAEAHIVWAGEQFLIDAGAQPWSGLPLWVAPNIEGDVRGFLAIDGSRALAAGLTLRPLVETARDTHAWAVAAPPPTVYRTRPPGGISTEREAELLEQWRQSSSEQARA